MALRGKLPEASGGLAKQMVWLRINEIYEMEVINHRIGNLAKSLNLGLRKIENKLHIKKKKKLLAVFYGWVILEKSLGLLFLLIHAFT